MALLESMKKSQIGRVFAEMIEVVKEPERIKSIIDREETVFLNKQSKSQIEAVTYELKSVYWERYDKVPPYFQTAQWIKSRGFEPSEQVAAVLKTKNCLTIELYDIHYATRVIPGADLSFNGKVYKDESEIPAHFKPMDYFAKHQLTPGASPIAKLLVNNQYYVDYYQIPISLNDSQRKEITKYPWLRNFTGAVYSCYKKELPNHLKTKKELDEAQLVVPEKATAYWYTGKLCVGLYDLNAVLELRENKSVEELSFSKGVLERGEWIRNPESYLMLDTETTGTGKDDEIIQLALVNLKGEVVYNQHFKPTVFSSKDAIAVHHISNEFLMDKPTFTDCWATISSHLEGKTILIQNASFDIRLLKQTCTRYRLEHSSTISYKDTLPYFKEVVKVGALKKVLTALNIPHDDSKLHDASEDCLKTIQALYQSLKC